MPSCDNLGIRYEAGLDVDPDPARALSLFQRACEGELMLGCNHLASMYRTGVGVPQDLDTAVRLYERACNGGMMEACANLAISYERGDGVSQDVATAVRLYQSACEEVIWACSRAETALELGGGAAAVAGYSVAATVVDTETRAPLSEAIVDVPALGIRVITDAAGRVEFEELPTGLHRVKTERVGYQVMEADLWVPGDREVVLLLDRTTLSDLGAPGRILGLVQEGGRELGLSGVAITVLSSPPVSALSGSEGRFSFTDVEPGLVEVQFERLGYATRTATVIVQPDRTVEISAEMSTQPIELEAIEVVVRSRVLEMNGFYQRAPWGDQLTRSDIEAINPIVISSLFRGPFRAGVSVRQGANGVPIVTGRRGCRMQIYFDGMLMEDWDFDSVPPQWLEGMEVYHQMFVPIEYFPACGVILLWR
jgi:hypothetical protein